MTKTMPSDLLEQPKTAIHKLFTTRSVFILALLLFLIPAAAISFYLSHRHEMNLKANNALYFAQKKVETELDAELERKEGSQKSAGGAISSLDDEEKQLRVYEFFDVNQVFPEGVKALQAVSQEFPGTRGGAEAQLQLGRLYFQHGQFKEALEWFQKAEKVSSGLDRAVASYSVASCQENLGQFKAALESYENTRLFGEVAIKTDLLLGIARCHEVLKDPEKAKTTYDKILADVPDTEVAKLAQFFKDQLE